MQGLTIALQMNSVEHLQMDTDTTFSLGLAAQKRGAELFYYQPKDLSLTCTDVLAEGHKVFFHRQKGHHYTLSDRTTLDLRSADVVLIRQDPPFDMAYITTTYILETLKGDTLVLNDPAGIRSSSEKLSVLTGFPSLTPPSLVTSSLQEIQAFRKEHKDLILKPLYGGGGEGILFLAEHDNNLPSLVSMYLKLYQTPLLAQAYVPAVAQQGDKRIILIDGTPRGALLRKAPPGDVRSNLHIGGTVAPTELSPRDQDICEAVGPFLRTHGLFLAGIDILGTFLTEMNVTSPTCLQEFERLTSISLETFFWDSVLEKL